MKFSKKIFKHSKHYQSYLETLHNIKGLRDRTLYFLGCFAEKLDIYPPFQTRLLVVIKFIEIVM